MGGSEQGLSVLCASVSGAGPELGGMAGSEAEHAFGRFSKRIRNVVVSFGGTVVERADAKVMAYFPESEDALQSAIEIQRRVVALPPFSGMPLTVGVGVCGGHASAEKRFFPEAGGNAATSLSDLAAPRQVLFSMPRRASPLPWMPLVAHGLPDLALASGQRRLGVFSVDWQKFDPFSLRLMISRGAGEGLMYLRFKALDMVLDLHRPLLTIGRHADSDFRLGDPRASRIHARIERRGSRFVLVDRSSNGTFVTLDGEPEHFIRNHEMPLRGRGVLSFGGPAANAGAECVTFEIAEAREAPAPAPSSSSSSSPPSSPSA